MHNAGRNKGIQLLVGLQSLQTDAIGWLIKTGKGTEQLLTASCMYAIHSMLTCAVRGVQQIG